MLPTKSPSNPPNPPDQSDGLQPFPGASVQRPHSRFTPSVPVHADPLLTAEDVARRLRVSTDWVWDHSSRKKPLLPVIRMGDGALRYRSSGIEAFIDERERVSSFGRRGR